MLFARRFPAWGYLIAVLGSALVFALRYSTDNPLRGFFTSLAFLLAVLASGLVGGWKPALLATLVCLANERFFFTNPKHSFAIPAGTDTMRILVYGVSGVAVSLLCEGLQRAWRRVAERQRQLEREMSERMAVAQERLHLVDQLRQADRRKDEFLATLAHELRNPLAPLSNAIELWGLVKNSPEQLEELREMMQRQLRQMTRLIDDLLDVSRISRGKIALRTEHVDLRILVTTAVDAVKPIIAANNQRLEIALPDEPVFVQADATRVSQVIGNVLHNAAKYTAESGEIWVRMTHESASAWISIRDTGCGIPPDLLASIFEMFQQVDQTLDRAQGGLGIGLTLAKRLVEMHGGSIDAKSDGPGRGSEFVISLPVDSSQEASAGAPAPIASAPSDLPHRRILVVDDMHESAQTLARMLRAIGQDVATAHDGQAALKYVGESKPEVVFLDIAMPGMNGYEVARRIRALTQIGPPVLIALTGYGQDDDRRRAREAGFDFHLTKPTSIEQLTSLLSRANGPVVAAER
jgi:signal transduction histidine kinase/ActR/RegA family two-component response regulator